VKSVATLCEHKFTLSLRIISKDFKSLYDNGALFHKRRLETDENKKYHAITRKKLI